MKVGIRYLGQLRTAAEVGHEMLEIADGLRVRELLAQAVAARPKLSAMVLGSENEIQKTLLIFIGDQQVDASRVLREGDEVLLMTPIAGG